MFVKRLILHEGYANTDDSYGHSNLICSDKNSRGKSTYFRFFFYALGYPIPEMKGVDYEKISAEIHLVEREKEFHIIRTVNSLKVTIVGEETPMIFSLPKEHIVFLGYLFDSANVKVLNNLLGIMYIDQDKGWTLLNRGTVIGRIKFDIDELIAGLANIDCDELLAQKRTLERNKNKYEAVIDINQLKEEVYAHNGEIFVSDVESTLNAELSLIDLQIRDLKENIKIIDKAIEKEEEFWYFVDSMNLQIKHNEEIISVSRQNVMHSLDSVEYLRARRSLLTTDLRVLNNKKAEIENKLQEYYENNTAITALFDDNDTQELILNRQLTTFSFDLSVVEKLLEKTKNDLRTVNKTIKYVLRKDNQYIDKIYRYVLKYAKILKIEDKVDGTKDYIFTEDLKSVSGANLQKLVFAFKVAFLKVIEESLGVKMIMVLDSPRGRELDNENLRLIMKIVEEELNDNQVFIASIYDDFNCDVKITLKERAIEERN